MRLWLVDFPREFLKQESSTLAERLWNNAVHLNVEVAVPAALHMRHPQAFETDD